MKTTIILERIPKIIIYLLVFLIPIWFLPVTQDLVNFQKQALLLVLVIIAVIVWLAKIINQGEVRMRLGLLDIPVLCLVVVVAISTATSLWRSGSFWGWPLNVSDGFITIFAFALLYFLISKTVKDFNELSRIFLVFIGASVIAGVYAILQLYHVFIIPLQFAKISTFNTVGSLNSIGILVATILPISLIMSFILKTKLKWLYYLLTFLLLAIMLLLNFLNIWILLIAELIFLLTFGMWKLKKTAEFKWISFPMALLVISLFFLIFRVSFPGSPALPLEVSPSISAEVGILKGALQQNPVLGTGPGTFVFDYAKYHQSSLNQTIFWGTRFTSGASEILDWFVTKGILGGLALILLMVTAIVLAVQRLLKAKNDNFSWMVELGIVTSFVGIVVAQILYYSNFTLSFLFWLLLGALGMFLVKSEKKISLAPPSFLAVASSFIFLMVLILGVGFLFIESEKYAAEVQYAKGAELISKGDTSGGIAKILSAAKFNPSGDLYYRDLSQLYLSQLSQIQADKSLSDDQKKQKSQVAISNAVAAVNQTIAINPANVENWNVRGFIYRNLIGVQGADTIAIESYTKARSLEPTSPFIFTELGRVYLTEAQSLANQKDMVQAQQEALAKALENLDKAVELKPDYAPAQYLIALVYGQQGKSEEEINKLEKIKSIAPNDIGLAFQLGVLYYQRNELDKAQQELERARSLQPDYANARYVLGLIYDRQGQKNKAIGEFTKVLELNPDNAQIKQIINNLNSDKPALNGISQSQPPIAENPPEIKKK